MWTFTPVGARTDPDYRDNLYTITLDKDPSCARRMLAASTVSQDGQGLMSKDDGTGRQRWFVEPVWGKPLYFTLRNAGGRAAGSYSYLTRDEST